MFSPPRCNYNKLKINLSIIINRLKLLVKKKAEISLKARKEIADYLKDNKIDRARIKVEQIILEDFRVEAMEFVEMYCDLLIARFGLFSSKKECDECLRESISTLIWATPHLLVDVPELKTIQQQFTSKFGKEFAVSCLGNHNQHVNPKVIERLSVSVPPSYLVEMYLVQIAKSYNVNYIPDPLLQKDEANIDLPNISFLNEMAPVLPYSKNVSSIPSFNTSSDPRLCDFDGNEDCHKPASSSGAPYPTNSEAAGKDQ